MWVFFKYIYVPILFFSGENFVGIKKTTTRIYLVMRVTLRIDWQHQFRPIKVTSRKEILLEHTSELEQFILLGEERIKKRNIFSQIPYHSIAFFALVSKNGVEHRAILMLAHHLVGIYICPFSRSRINEIQRRGQTVTKKKKKRDTVRVTREKYRNVLIWMAIREWGNKRMLLFLGTHNYSRSRNE